MIEWEYTTESSQGSPLTTEELNKYGEYGWKLVSFNIPANSIIFYYIFIRPKTDYTAIMEPDSIRHHMNTSENQKSYHNKN